MYIIIQEVNGEIYNTYLDSYGKDVISFGRNGDNDIVLNGDNVSRVHGCFFRENGNWKISDLDSTNGIYNRGQKIKEKFINKDDVITIPDKLHNDRKTIFTFRDISNEKKVAVKENKNTEGLFVDSNENFKAVLGSGYIDNIIRGDGLVKNIGVLTDKRYYFKGECFYRGGTHYSKSNEEWTIDLKDITSTGFIYEQHISLMVIGILCMVVGGAASTQNLYYGSIGIIAGIVFMIAYMLSKEVTYIVTFSGGCIGLDASTYGGEKAVKIFDKQLRRAKDAVSDSV